MRHSFKVSLSIFVLMGVLFCGLSADAQEQIFAVDSGIQVNPLYEGMDVAVEQNYCETELELMQSAAELDNVEELKSKEAVAMYLNQELIRRNTTISFGYITSNTDIKAEMREIWDMALYWQQEINPVSGDYLRYQFGSYRMKGQYYTDSEGLNHCTFTYTVTYYADAEQEQEVSQKVSEVLQQLEMQNKTTPQKIYAIYDYICRHVKYDTEHADDMSYVKKFSAYAALIEGEAVCQGYALLFYRMCREIGIDTRIVAGTANGTTHAWNIVQLDGKYYNVDATWDALVSANNSDGSLENVVDYNYLLKSEYDFVGRYRAEEFSTEQFMANYPMAEESYQTKILRPEKVKELKVSTGERDDELRIIWSTVDADGYELYMRVGGKDEYTLIAVFENKDAEEADYVKCKEVEGKRYIECTDTKLPTGANYYYRVRAFRYHELSDSKVFGAFSDIKGGSIVVKPPNFQVKGYFGGKQVEFFADSANVDIYYSKTDSAITLEDAKVENRGIVLFEPYYGSVYARAYDLQSGAWSVPARLILKISKVKEPVIIPHERYTVIQNVTPGACLVYTLDGSVPTMNNGKKVWSSSIRVQVKRGQILKAAAFRSCFGGSAIVEYLN